MFDHEIDRTDRLILSELQSHGRMTNADLAERVHLSASACSRRVARLEDLAVIEGYHAQINPRSVGKPATVFVEITLSGQSEAALDAFERAVSRCPDVLECHLMTGEADYLLRLAAADTEDFERIHRSQLTGLPGIARMRSAFALRRIIRRPGLPLKG